nr:AlNc14C72G4935 [Albugo laibachii Nc14]|eukprot:CCA19509.1 AlNc14C72G4935 [Albugo laibachii Nc14]
MATLFTVNRVKTRVSALRFKRHRPTSSHLVDSARSRAISIANTYGVSGLVRVDSPTQAHQTGALCLYLRWSRSVAGYMEYTNGVSYLDNF